MSNASFVSSKRPLTSDQVGQTLRKINQDHFGGAFSIKSVMETGWAISHPEVKDEILWEIWLQDTKRRVEGKPPLSRRPWAVWAHSLFEHAMARSWGGRISYEGLSEKTYAPLEKLWTFQEFMQEVFPDRPVSEMEAETPENLHPFMTPGPNAQGVHFKTRG